MVIFVEDIAGALTLGGDGVTAAINGVNGIDLFLTGTCGPLSVSVTNSEFTQNGGTGLYIETDELKLTKGADLDLQLTELDFRDNAGYGLFLKSARTMSDVDISMTECYFEENVGTGLGFFLETFESVVTVNMDKVIINDNNGHGMYVRTNQNYYSDEGGYVQPEGTFRLILDHVDITDNDGNGVQEEHYIYGYTGSSPYTTLNYQVMAQDVKIEGNNVGYNIRPYGSSYGNYYGIFDADYTFHESDITDNRYEGIYSYFRFYNYANYGYTSETINIINSTISYNDIGVRTYAMNPTYGTESYINLRGSTVTNNDRYGLYSTGYRSGNRAYSYQKIAEWDVFDCLIDDAVYLDLSGFYSYNGYYEPHALVSFINNTYTHDQPMFINMESYYYEYYEPLVTTFIYKGNIHTSSSLDDGLSVNMFGGAQLQTHVEIEDVNFYSPLGDGIRITLGTVYTSTAASKSVGGTISIKNVNIDGAIGNGITINIQNAVDGGVFYNTFLSLHDVTITGCDSALSTEQVNGEVKNCKFLNPRQFAIYIFGGVIDVYSSIVGPIETNNLYVDQMGAIRLWFHLTVHVVWEDSGLPVIGAQVDIKDNSWKIIGVSGIEGTEGILFSNLNSHTVLADGVFTRNPYIINVDFIGIVKEKKVNMKGTSEVTITLRDDILPRLFIDTPMDSHKQRETSVEVRGNAYDRHTGIDRVEVSLNGGYWYTADGTDTYTHTLEDLPEGISVIRVRAFDNSDNMKEMMVAIYVDTTPPALSVVSPIEGFMTSDRNLDIIGTSDVGAIVLVNNQHVDLDYTLLSHRLVLVEGINEIRVTSLDALGNSRSITRNVTLDTYIPFITILTDDVVVNTPRTTLMGMTEETGVIITVDGSEVPVGKEGLFEAEVTLEEGLNVIMVKGTDLVGNERITNVKFILDLTPPWFEVALPTPGFIGDDRNVKVKGFIEEGAELFVNEKVVSVAFGQFETFINAPEGASELVVVAIDEAGNQAERKIAIEVDSQDPLIVIQFPPDDYVTNKVNVHLEGYINPSSEDLSRVDLFVDEVPWSFDKTLGIFRGEISLEEGMNRITVRGVDLAGNMHEVECKVMLDSEAPFLDVKLMGVRMDPQWNEPVATDEFVYVTGFTEIGTTPTVNDVLVRVDPETGYFNYTLELPAPAQGSKISTTSIVVMSTDEAGNVATKTLEVNRLRDVAADEDKATSAEWLVLLLALIIFGMAFIGALAYQRFQTQEEVIEGLESQTAAATVTEGGKVISPPPERPHRGGVPRRRPEVTEEDSEVILEIDEEEV
jgi:hypothetical protein